MAFRYSILADEDLKPVSQHLQKCLVNLIDLALQLKQAHWNVRGNFFRPLHLQLDEILETIRDASDDVAERLAALGVPPDGRSATVNQNTDLEAYPPEFTHWRETVQLVADRLNSMVTCLRDGIKVTGEHDPVSEDLLIGISAEVEKHLWMVQAQEDRRET